MKILYIQNKTKPDKFFGNENHFFLKIKLYSFKKILYKNLHKMLIFF